MTPKINSQRSKRPRGRPVVFDRDHALGEAMKLFWERGYEGTSFDDLIAVMTPEMSPRAVTLRRPPDCIAPDGWPRPSRCTSN